MFRYCVKKLISQVHGAVVDVVLLTRLPRISGGCGYTALGGGKRKAHV